ncbi:hypothetical protein HKD42_00595 [Altererythrobacter sp. RZ02]|uniref:Chitooligosaccharide deacetylase n=1 Tax=Pontixanthobacter rizhaonensis TaxID=2730337 RepID=A0A848QIR2_9SPHN|nr:hypothetical protein [Pontixanthobacter rizhaonensis]NMW30563.1 hypothetical protein [Pontixanthobacter rizhaonensis]
MTQVYITVDTEYSASIVQRMGKDCRAENYARSISATTPEGDVGIAYQIDFMNRYGLKGVFFVDPMPALIWGTEAITDIVEPIVEAGHDVQLHLHSEWLEFAGDATPVNGRTGRNIKDFTFDDQCTLLDYARTTLIAAGAPRPTAFRAGNYGANDDTCRALAALGFTHETSHCPGIAVSACDISLTSTDRQPLQHCGLIEVPIGCVETFGGELRHAQITALSSAELKAAMKHSRANGVDALTLVSHSFELLCRQREKINWIVRRRFEALCKTIAAMNGVGTATYAANPPSVSASCTPASVVPLDPVRSGYRVAEQAVANILYGGS